MLFVKLSDQMEEIIGLYSPLTPPNLSYVNPKTLEDTELLICLKTAAFPFKSTLVKSLHNEFPQAQYLIPTYPNDMSTYV